jgi:flavin-dependent dehydrogenase
VVERNVGKRLHRAEQVGKYRGAPISYTKEVGPIATPGALWIGEAARLTNAATGEGIYYAMRSGQIASQVVGRHKKPGVSLYDEYTERTRRAFTLRLHAAVAFLRFVGTPAFSWIASMITSSGMQKPMQWLLANV